MIDITEIHDCNDLIQYSDEWEELLNAGDGSSPYLTPEFLLPWLRLCLQDNQNCRFLVARENGQLAGLLPLTENRPTKFGVTCAVLGFPTFGVTPPSDVIASHNSAALVSAFICYLKQQKNWDILTLKNIPVESITSGCMKNACKDNGLDCEVSEGVSTFYVPVSGSWDAFFSSKSKKIRSNTRRNWRKAKEWGEPSFSYYPSDNIDFQGAVRMVMEVTSSSWKEFEESQPALLEFFMDLMRALDSHGLLGLRFLSINETPVAYLLEIQYKNTVYPFHNAYVASYQRISPGQLILSNELQWAFDNKRDKVDFCGTSDYLRRWTNSTRQFVDVQVVRPSLISRIKLKLYNAIHNKRQHAANLETLAIRDQIKEEHRTRSTNADK